MHPAHLKILICSTAIIIFMLNIQTVSAGSVEAGEKKAAVCNHCHKNNTDSAIPKIAGQHEVYIVAQLQAYRDGSRQDEIMQTVASRLKNDNDINDLAAYYSSLPKAIDEHKKPNNRLGEEVFHEKAHCYQCHGTKGQGNSQSSPIVPSIAGQNKDFIIKRLMEFQSQRNHKPNKNPMPSVAKQLDIVDIFSVAEYINDL